MFKLFRQKLVSGISYNETTDYTFLEIHGVTGLYTTQPVLPDSLPQGFKAFSLLGEPEFRQIQHASTRKAKSLFICRASEVSKFDCHRCHLSKEDYRFLKDQPFDWYAFQQFFGQSICLETMIKDAEAKQKQQFGSKEKSQEKEPSGTF